MVHKLLTLTVTLALLWLIAPVQAGDGRDHDADAQTTEVDNDQHADDHDGDPDGHEDEADDNDNHEGEADHDDHDDELAIELSPQAVALAGVATSTATYGRISTTIELPGEVGFNEDQLAHIAPRFAGIAQEARYRVGDYIDEGSVVAVVESNESMNSYFIKAPISGWVIERHITPGEFVSGENSIYVIADLSSVWVNLAVYPKDFDRVNKGQPVRIKMVGSSSSTTGTIDYITPIIDFRTRSATARITLPNPDNDWRPGTFVQATITTPGEEQSLVVEKNAIQYLGEESVVFVTDGVNRFRPVEVTTGESDAKFTHVVSGLSEGMEYVSHGAFELKAKIVTSNLDAHAGHGH